MGAGPPGDALSAILRLLSASYDWTLYGEDYDSRLWLHCTVHKWTPGVRRRLNAVLDGLQRPLWVLDNDPHLAPNLPRFLTRHMRFRVVGLLALDGLLRTTFVRDPLPHHGQGI